MRQYKSGQTVESCRHMHARMIVWNGTRKVINHGHSRMMQDRHHD